MAPSFDCAVSNLLCAEDNNSIFDDNDHYDATVEEFEATWHHGNHQICNQNGGGDGGWLPLQSDECLVLMVEKECQHLPNGDYLKRLRNGDLDMGARKEAVEWIAKAGSFLFSLFFHHSLMFKNGDYMGLFIFFLDWFSKYEIWLSKGGFFFTV